MNISANLHKCFCPSEDPAEVSGRGGQDAADSGDHGVRRDRLQHCSTTGSVAETMGYAAGAKTMYRKIVVIFAWCTCSSLPHCSISPCCIPWQSSLEAAPSWPRGRAASGEVQWPLQHCSGLQSSAALQWPISNIGNNIHSCILQPGPGINNQLRHYVAVEFTPKIDARKNFFQ